jgi:hypothetical protein
MARKKSTSGRQSLPPPKCKAILLCDQVIVDARTGKSSVIGIIGGFVLPTFPMATPPCTAFLQLTSGIGSCQITVEIHDLQSDQIIARAAAADVAFADRSAKINIIIPVPSITLQHAGLYDFVVLSSNEEIDRQQFRAQSFTPEGGTDSGEQNEENDGAEG